MALRMKSDRFEMVDSWEIRIGQESIVHRFGRRVSIREAVQMATAWLETLGKDATPKDETPNTKDSSHG